MNEKHSKASLMLLEMLFVVFFFAVVSAVYVQVFAGAKTLGSKSRNLSEATLIASNMIEAFTEANGDFDETADILLSGFSSDNAGSDSSVSANLAPTSESDSTPPPSSGQTETSASVTTNSVTLCYDESWQILTSNASDAPAYTATLSVGGGATHLLTGRVTVVDSKGSLLCELPVSYFVREAVR